MSGEVMFSTLLTFSHPPVSSSSHIPLSKTPTITYPSLQNPNNHISLSPKPQQSHIPPFFLKHSDLPQDPLVLIKTNPYYNRYTPTALTSSPILYSQSPIPTMILLKPLSLNPTDRMMLMFVGIKDRESSNFMNNPLDRQQPHPPPFSYPPYLQEQATIPYPLFPIP